MILEQSKISQPGTVDVLGQVSLCCGGCPVIVGWSAVSTDPGALSLPAHPQYDWDDEQ